MLSNEGKKKICSEQRRRLPPALTCVQDGLPGSSRIKRTRANNGGGGKDLLGEARNPVLGSQSGEKKRENLRR